MYKLLTKNRDIQDEIKKLFSKASEIKCAVAFWGKGAANIFPCKDNVSIQIVCNYTSGATNPEEIEKIKNQLTTKNSDVKMNNILHAKVYWTDQGVIIGSANASSNGLVLEDKEITGWEEVSVYTDDKKVIQETKGWFDNQIWPNSKPITKSDYNAAIKRWETNRKTRINNKNITFLDALKSGVYLDRNIYIIIDCLMLKSEQIEEGNKQVNIAKQNVPFLNNKSIEYWYGYDSIPRDATIFDFSLTNKKIEWEGLYYTLPEKYDSPKDQEGLSYQFCEQIQPSSIPMPISHFNSLKKSVILYYQNQLKSITDDKGLEISFDEFYKEIIKRKLY
ncbi:phospholipase D-like domain-containing protein [Chitinispirillales bacterium ANBcel5]|uniref:phospholipase D family protein n=1 Tax=Cellulosispirillum alkaliphilum TaxID=3039283 RepID=UPI002A5005F4|nr:phospholipase D-like domain-containing protein [Chitinispirillales bacterium ANBcel5]